MMKFFSKEKRTISVAWRYSVNGILWRIKLSPNNRIVCETRHQEYKTVAFSCLDEHTGQLLWENLRFDEPWWIGIEDITDSVVYLHSYRKPDLPQHQGIFAVELETGVRLWETREYTYLFFLDNLIYASKQQFETQRFYTLDPLNGIIAQEIGDDPLEINAMRKKLNEYDVYSDYFYPEYFDENHLEYDNLKDIVFRYASSNIMPGPIDILRSSNLLFVSWHEIQEKSRHSSPMLNQKFYILCSDTGEMLYNDQISTGVQSPSIDSFFIKDKQLFYIKDMRSLVAIKLNSEAES